MNAWLMESAGPARRLVSSFFGGTLLCSSVLLSLGGAALLGGCSSDSGVEGAGGSGGEGGVGSNGSTRSGQGATGTASEADAPEPLPFLELVTQEVRFADVTLQIDKAQVVPSPELWGLTEADDYPEYVRTQPGKVELEISADYLGKDRRHVNFGESEIHLADGSKLRDPQGSATLFVGEPGAFTMSFSYPEGGAPSLAGAVLLLRDQLREEPLLLPLDDTFASRFPVLLTDVSGSEFNRSEPEYFNIRFVIESARLDLNTLVEQEQYRRSSEGQMFLEFDFYREVISSSGPLGLLKHDVYVKIDGRPVYGHDNSGGSIDEGQEERFSIQFEIPQDTTEVELLVNVGTQEVQTLAIALPAAE